MNVLIIAAHPDDEILGCGGTMARHVSSGDSVAVEILAEGVTSRDERRSRDSRTRELGDLRSAALQANAVLGVRNVRLHDLPDNRMDSLPLIDVVKLVEEIVREREPDIVYTHHGGDLNIDHRVTARAVLTACRPLPGARVRRILSFEVPSSTEWQAPASAEAFMPAWFNDISDTLELKLKALDAYASEMRAWPHARSVEAVSHLARWRGASVGRSAAEAFTLLRQID
jgi:LmbE family N-acetylglucosaminyl deacetylase